MSKKLFAGAVFAFGLALAVNASAFTFDSKIDTLQEKKDVQTVLNMNGASLTVDGVFGPKTMAAVKAFQTLKGLTADGIIGPMTRAALTAASTGTTTGGTTTPTTPSSLCPNGMTLASNCTVAPGATTTGTLTGGAGSISLTSTSTDVESKVKEGSSSTKILGFKVQADGGDVAVSNLKVTFKNVDAGTSSKRLSRYAGGVSVWMGSTKVGSASVADFIKDGDEYSKSIALSNAVVKMGTSNKGTFYVTVDANSAIDSTDMASDNWAVKVSDVRYTDATGVILTTTTTVGSLTSGSFDYEKLATSGDVKVTVSKGSASPVAQTVKTSDVASTKDVLMLEFKVKATGTKVSFDTLNITSALTTAGTATGDNYAGIVGELQLKKGSDVLATIDGSDLDGTETFSLDNTYTIDADTTDTFRVYATINDADNFTSGAKLAVSFASFSPEDSNGDVISDTGSAVGSEQTLVFGVPTLTKVDSSLKVTTATDGTGAGQEDLYTATMKFTVTAPDDNAVYLPLDTFAFGTAGTAGVQYTVTGGATVVSANLQYSGTDSLSSITEANSYRVDAGASQQFTLSVVLKGNDAYGKVTMTGISYETSQGTPDNTPTATIADFYTSSVSLAK